MEVQKLGSEARILDTHFSLEGHLSERSRQELWQSIASVLDGGAPVLGGAARTRTGMAVGYVQSGKTTSFTGLMGAAADDGYRVVVALLGSTSLLLAQNSDRVRRALALDVRRDYKWVHLENPSLRDTSPLEIGRYLERGRRVLITLLKHHGRIDDAAAVMNTESVRSVPALIVDDEADQVSLNTQVDTGEESATYAAVKQLRAVIGPHLYVQYTATPYAPLLLAAEDLLSPDFVVLLSPGDGYVGGYEFLIEQRENVVRQIGDAPAPSDTPTRLPSSVRTALADFLAGCALLLGERIEAAPVSMLVHPTDRTDPQRRYEVLIDLQIRQWIEQVRTGIVEQVFKDARASLVRSGCRDLDDETFVAALRMALAEATIWRINSDRDATDRVQWNLAPVHILIGGNKLSRGFTIEGLTVSWLGRSVSPQLDTLVQRARAYGYRRSYLPYCRIYAASETIEGLTSAVSTDLDMRAQLRDWIERGLPIKDWGTEIGISIGSGFRPSRSEVLSHLAEFRPGWHMVSKPDLDPSAEVQNLSLVDSLGVRGAPIEPFGRLSHPCLERVEAGRVRDLVMGWQVAFSPGWDRDGVLAWLSRQALAGRSLPVVYLATPDSMPRVRSWDERLGFEQLMQGRDPVSDESSYPGDRELFGRASQLQIHFVRPRQGGRPVHTIALNAAGPSRLIRRGSA